MIRPYTGSGYIRRIAAWTAAEGRPVNARRPATIFITDDGAVEAWAYTGSRPDALRKLAKLSSPHFSTVARADGNWIYVEPAPSDFWAKVGDDWHAKTAKYPDILAW